MVNFESFFNTFFYNNPRMKSIDEKKYSQTSSTFSQDIEI